MARARNIKPGFFRNEELAGLPFEYRLLFIGLWTLADREGRLEDRPKRIRMELFPADDVDCDAGIKALETCGLVVRYQDQGGAYIWIPTFLDHQKPHPREVPSTIPQYQGATKATPRQDQGDTKALPGPADVLNPDVLNPESKLHPLPELETPDPGQPAAGALPAEAGTATPKPGSVAVQAAAALDALRVTPPVGSDAHDRAGELWGVLAANGCRGTAAHPSVIEMARSGVTVAELRSAIAEARKSNPGQLNPAYLAAIVSRFRTDPPKHEAAGWKTDDAKAEALCRQLGIRGAKAGEDRATWHARITAAMASKAQQQVA